MPTYEYACKACDLEFEREQRISDPPAKTCPRCKSKQVKRLISRTSFHLKGGGWYSDLYSKKSDAKSPKKDGDSKPDSKSDSKPDSKPATSEGSPKSDAGAGSSTSGGSTSGGSTSGGSSAGGPGSKAVA